MVICKDKGSTQIYSNAKINTVEFLFKNKNY